MQVKFKWGTKEQILELMKTRPSITKAEVYFDKTDGSLYVVSFNEKASSSKIESLEFDDYIRIELNKISYA